MTADELLPEYDERRSGAHSAPPTLTGDAPGLSRVRAALAQRGSQKVAGAPLTQAGAPAPSTHIGPTAAYATSVRTRAATSRTTTKGSTTMRRITRTIQHLIAGGLSSQRVARANAASASDTLGARREAREGVDAYLAAHHATLTQDAADSSSTEATPQRGSRVGARPRGEETAAGMKSLDPAAGMSS